MTVNHGVLGSSPCSGAIARGLQARCRKADVDSAFRLIAEVLQSQAIFGIGSLAQLVQSICLTSRGSAVRIRQLPLQKASNLDAFFVFVSCVSNCADEDWDEDWDASQSFLLYCSLKQVLPTYKMFNTFYV